MEARFEFDCPSFFRRKPEIIDDVPLGNVGRLSSFCPSFHFHSEAWPRLVSISPWQAPNHFCRSWPTFSRNSGGCKFQPLQISPDFGSALTAKVAVFLRALFIIRSNSDGRSGLMRTGAVGAELRMALNVAADVVPRKGSTPVAIS